LIQAGIKTENQAVEHFLLFGHRENRLYTFRSSPIDNFYNSNIGIETIIEKTDTQTSEYQSNEGPISINKSHHYIIKKEEISHNFCFNIHSKILIKIPTLSRPEQLLSSIESFYKHAHNKKNIHFLITIDHDDRLTNNGTILAKLMKYENLTICKEKSFSKIDAYNLNIDMINFDILILSSDDMIAIKPSYDEIIIHNMKKHFPDLDGVLWFDTGDKNTITNTLAIAGKKFYEQIKPIYKYCYTGYYCDDEFGQIAMKLGKMVRVEESIIKHNIPDYLLMSNDSTYLKSLSYGLKDRTIYKIRKAVQFDIPGAQQPPLNHNIPKKFLATKRNIDWANYWLTTESKYDDPISVMDLYVLEDTDQYVAQMNKEQFVAFAKNYFRNFRWTIPHMIHQIWMGGPIPPQIKEMMETFSVDYIKKNPGSQYILWDENKLKKYKMINKDLFDKEDKYDCKSDIARVEILNRFGGFYIDSDTIWLGNKSILSAPSSYGITIAYEKAGIKIGNRYLNDKTTRCANGVFGSTIQNPIMAFIIGQMRKSYADNRENGVVASTGPDFIQSILDSIKPNININILNHKYFYPSWWCIDPKNNPNYQEFLQTKDMTNPEIAKKYPDAILFHKGFTSAIEGIEK
jgi:mannosyltransferase OCH1-like enzyme